MKHTLEEISNKIAASSKNARLCAVTKGHYIHEIESLIGLGVMEFGENRVQEALEKWQHLKAKYPFTKLHLIGHLQKNKVKDALKVFDVIETIDSIELAKAIAKFDITDKEFLIQVNVGNEEQKSGLNLSNLNSIEEIKQILPISGLMCIPPEDQEPRPFFQKLKAIAKYHQLTDLSMGMSNDYDIALEEGATIIRVGRKLFDR